MVKNLKTTVLDIGARYGIHPNWKNFTGEKNFILIEPDKNEYTRLKKKYKKFNDIKIFKDGIAEKDKNMTLNIFENPAMSSSLNRKNISPLFWGERKSQIRIKKKVYIKCKSLDNFILSKKLQVDFLKIDVEGLETKILESSNKIFKTMLGIRSEVSFADIFGKNKNDPGSFVDLHKKMIENNFTLLNLDYDGKGDYFSELLISNSRYGVLQNTDAVWIKNLPFIFRLNDEVKLFKIVSFLILNNAYDLAIFILNKSSSKFKKYKSLDKTNLYNFVKISILKHLYKLKWIPGQKISNHKKIFEKIFGEKYLSMNEYNENVEINPY